MLTRRDDTFWARGVPQLLNILATSVPQLRSLECQYPSGVPVAPASALPSLIGQLSQLTSLSLDTGGGCITTAQVDAMVLGLPALQHLSLSQGEGEHSSLSLTGIARSCSRLTEVCIQGASLGAVTSQLGALSALTRMELSECRLTSLPGNVSRLTSLRELNVSQSSLHRLPPELTACQQLTHLAMGGDCHSLVLALLQTLRSLRVVCIPLPNDLTTFWPQLTALTELELWTAASHPIPAGLGGMTGLRTLRIVAGGGDLPAGPYLSGLETLTMHIRTFPMGVPANLVAATQLRHLSLLSCVGEIKLMCSDMAIVSSLPALATVSLIKPADVS